MVMVGRRAGLVVCCWASRLRHKLDFAGRLVRTRSSVGVERAGYRLAITLETASNCTKTTMGRGGDDVSCHQGGGILRVFPSEQTLDDKTGFRLASF